MLIGSTNLYAQIKVTNIPSWTVDQQYNSKPDVDLKDISYGLLTLLNDEQIHIPNQERYIRLVKKITDNVGVQDASSISINYDPTYQQLFLHKINVVRQGEIINKLDVNNFQTIRKESISENYIYDGSLNAVAHLSDIRNGDIVDLSYTIKGFNPIHDGKFSGATILNDFQPVGKINYYLISKNKLYYKTINYAKEPHIENYMGYTTYHWQTVLPETPQFEDNTPTWYLPYQHLFVSEYENWDNVVNWALNIYKDEVSVSLELNDKIEQIKKKFLTEGERITTTLQFVQNEIRYLGLESGIGAYKPFSPSKVFSERFGDCKDKSWLMVTMLRKMGTEAYPVLVSTIHGESLHQFLPSPKLFDHVVVKVIDSSNTTLFYDPSNNNQYGTYKSIAFPNYGKALVVKKGVTSLENVNSNNTDLVEVFDTYDLPTIGGPGTLKVMTVYHEAEADAMRAHYKSQSSSALSKDFKNYYERFYDGIEVLKDPIFEDDSLSNRLLVEEFYKINNIWDSMVIDDKNIGVELSPYSIFDIAIIPSEKERSTPFALYYPTHKKHQITVKLPQKWNIEKEEILVNSKSFDFSMQTKMNPSKTILYLNYEYQNKHSFVNPKDFTDYYKKIKEVEQISAYYVYIPKLSAKTLSIAEDFMNDKFFTSTATIFLYIVAFIVLLAIGAVVYVIQSNRKRQ
jgi:hypothetical protein